MSGMFFSSVREGGRGKHEESVGVHIVWGGSNDDHVVEMEAWRMSPGVREDGFPFSSLPVGILLSIPLDQVQISLFS